MARKTVLIVVSIVVLALVLPLLLLQFPPVQDSVKNRAIELINSKIAGRLHVGEIGGNLVSEWELRSVRIEHEGKTIARVGILSLQWNPLQLLSNSIAIDEITVRDGHIDLVGNRHGWNIVKAFSSGVTQPEKPARPGKPLAIHIGEIALEHMSARVVTGDTERQLTITEFRGDFNRNGDELRFGIDALTGKISNPEISLEALEGGVEVTLGGRKRIELIGVQAKALGAVLETDSNVALYPGGKLDVKAKIRNWGPSLWALAKVPLQVPTTVVLGAKGRWPDFTWEFAADTTAGTVTASGQGAVPADGKRLRFDMASFNANVALRRVEPAVLIGNASAAGTEINAKVAGRVQLQPHGVKHAVLSLDGSRSRIRGQPVRRLDARFGLKDSRLDAKFTVVSRTTNGKVQASYALASKRFRGKVEVDGLRPGDFLGEGWAGVFRANATFRGRGADLGALLLTGTLHSPGGMIAGSEFQELNVPVSIRDGRVHVAGARFDGRDFDVRAQGTWPLAKNRSGRLRLLARTENVGALLPVTGPVRSGRAMIRVIAAGRLDRMRVSGSLHAQRLKGASLDIPDGDVYVEATALDLQQRTGSLEVTTELDAPRWGKQTFQTAAIAISFSKQATTSSGTFLVRAIDLQQENRVRGKFDLYWPGIVFVLEDLAVKLGDSQWVNHGEAVIDTRAEGVRIENLDLRSGEQRIFSAGRLDDTGQQHLEMLINRVQLTDLAPVLGRRKLTGQLDGTAWLTGTMKQPQLQASVAVAEPVIEGYELQLATVVVTFAQQMLELQVRVREKGGKGALTADVAMPTNRDQQGNIPIKGRVVSEGLSLRILYAVTDKVDDIAGDLEINAVLAGTLRAPEVRGTVEIINGALRVVPLGTAYSNVDARATLTGRRAVLESLRVTSKGKGTLSATGRAMVPVGGAAGYIRARISAENFLVIDNNRAEARVDGKLAVGGTFARPEVTGRLESERVIIKVPDRQQKQLEPVTFDYPGIYIVGEEEPVPGEGEETTVTVPLAKRAVVNVQVIVDRNAWVRGTDVNVELAGTLRVQKPPGEEKARITGEIRSVRGLYRLQGRRLEVREAIATFQGTSEIDPRLDVTLTYEVPDYEIQVSVTGTTQKPNITLSSQPPLEQADIIAVLVFGRPFDQLGGGEQTEMRERVGSLLGGFAAEQLRKQLGGQLGIDTLEITPGTEGGTEVGLGKYVAEDVFVQYVQRFGQETASEVRLEYYFSARWLVQTTASTAGESGVDIFWNVRF